MVARLTIHVIIPGKPQAMARARATVINGHVRVYDPHAKARKMLSIQLSSQFPSLIEGAVKVEILAHYKARRKKDIGEYRTIKPDVDNITKKILDVLNGIAYADDAQVASVCCKKIWWNCDETHVFVSKI